MIEPAPALVVFAVLVLILAALFWPRRGLVPALLRLRQLSTRVQLEDALKHVFMCQRTAQTCSIESVAGRLGVSRAKAASLVSSLVALQLIQAGGDGLRVTEAGTQSALQLVRTHRLWERYLADRTGVPPAEWHDEAERMEHALSTEQVDRLAARLGHPRWDPHGDPIPTSRGEIPPPRGFSLLDAAPGQIVEIVHLEDEPPEIYRLLLHNGLAPGGRIELVERIDHRLRLKSGGREWTLDPVSARNVTVRDLPEAETTAPEATLLDVARGATVRVEGLAPSCQGTQRRRLLDLGVVRGAAITPELVSAAGDPIAYRIRGALIALRSGQAAQVLVSGPAQAPQVA